MNVFQVAITGDFLDERGNWAYGDDGYREWTGSKIIQSRFLTDLAPQPNDPGYWDRFYSLEVNPASIVGMHGLAVLRPKVSRQAIQAAAETLTFIGRSGAGYEKIDVDACTNFGVALFNVPDALNHSTASSALLFILALAKQLPLQDRVTRQADWRKQAEIMGDEIRGKTLGIIGLGNSGRELARLIAPFHMQVLAYSPHAEAAQAAALGVRLIGLEDLLRQSDFVSIHCRYTPEVYHMIGEPQLNLMKPTAYFVNVARGAIVDQPALVSALRSRRIAGAALDVFECEPLPAEDPLIQLDNVILAPHWSASTREVWRTTGTTIAKGMLLGARGLVPQNVVNPAVLENSTFLRKLAKFRENANEYPVD